MKIKLLTKTLILTLTLLLVATSCNKRMYPYLSGEEGNIGFTFDKYKIKHLTSVGNNGYVMINNPRLFGGKTIGFSMYFIGAKEEGTEYFLPQSDITAEWVGKSGKSKLCTVHKSDKGVNFPSKSEEGKIGDGYIYVTSPKRMKHAKFIRLRFTLADEQHTLCFTPKEDNQTNDLSQLELPNIYGNKEPEVPYIPASEPIKVVLTPEQEKVQQSITIINNITNNIRNEITQEFNSTIISMRENNQLSDNVDTKVKADIVQQINDDGKVEYDLRVKYEYTLKDLNEEKRVELGNVADDFPPGKYKLADSKAARITVSMLKNTIEQQLKPYLEPGRKVTVKITGSTDASPIRNAIAYDGMYNDLTNQSCFVNGIIDFLNITKQEGIQKNEELAYLRTYGVRDFIENNVEALRVTDNQFQHYAIVSDKTGAEQRKVSMEIIIHEAFGKEHAELAPENQKPLDQLISDVDTGIVVTNMNNPDAIAVVIGNQKYSNQVGTAKDVLYAVNDAKVVKEYLIKTLGFKEENILYQENATSTNFRTFFGTKDAKGKLDRMVKEGRSDVFIFYSGHGVPDRLKHETYLLPVDVDGSTDDAIHMNAYNLNLLYDQVRATNPRSATIVLDACYSGNGVDRQTSGVGEVPFEEPAPDKLSNMVVFTAVSNNQEASWFEEKYHGMFTYFFLYGLKHNTNQNFNSDRQLTYRELFKFISDEQDGVPYWAGRKGIDQNPNIQGSILDNVLVTY